MANRVRPLFTRCDRVADIVQKSRSIAPLTLRTTHIRPVCLRSTSCPFVCSNFTPFFSTFSSSSIHSSSSSSFPASVRIFSSSVSPPAHRQRSDYSSLAPTAAASGLQEIVVQRFDGLPVLSVPMPSRRENCRFVLKPLTNTLTDFVTFLKQEDAAIEDVAAYTEGDEVIPGLTSVDILLRNNFYIHINNERYFVRAPQPDKLAPGEETEDLSNVKDTVARLFRALCSDQFHVVQQRQLLTRLEEIKVELEPMEKARQTMHERAVKRMRTLSWVGLGLMGLQFGFLARLTWWEYSWDIMEPVTYFVTYGTAMAMFAYHLLTIQDYSYPDAHDREIVMSIHRLARKNAFDFSKYNRLRTEKTHLEFDLERLRHPLEVKLNPPFLPRSTHSVATPVTCKA